ncbi:MAG: alpha/beta hydrolase-fold protein [Pararhizobium sp.]
MKQTCKKQDGPSTFASRETSRAAMPETEMDTMPVTMPSCRRFILNAETGLAYEIFVFVPDAPPPPQGFPVIYVLDANSDFITVAETVRRVSRRPKATGIDPAVVIGIGYPKTGDYNADRRHYDFTRGPADAGVFPDRDGPDCGGQAAYIRFLTHRLLPHVAAHIPIDDARRTLLGHSLAGYFALDLLAQHPDMFAGYIAFSPSIWWDRPVLSASLREAGTMFAGTVHVYAAVGGWEQELAPWQSKEQFGPRYHQVRQARRMIDNVRELMLELTHAFGARAAVKFEVRDDEDHATVVTSALCRALRHVTGRA